MSRQPFFFERYGKQHFEFADTIHDYGLYLPNNADMTVDEIEFVCGIVNQTIDGDLI
jgi:dTDP-4-amino-4,6-dideoxygalactose transaminase